MCRCERYAKEELDKSRTSEVQSKLARLKISESEVSVASSVYTDVTLCIAAILKVAEYPSVAEDFKTNIFLRRLRMSLKRKQTSYFNFIWKATVKTPGVPKNNTWMDISNQTPAAAEEKEAGSVPQSAEPELPAASSPQPMAAAASASSAHPATLNEYLARLLLGKSYTVSKTAATVVSPPKTHTTVPPASSENYPDEPAAAEPMDSDTSSYPVFDEVVAVVEAQFSHFFFTQSPTKAARYMYMKCIELLDSRQDVSEGQIEAAKKLLHSRFGKALKEAQGVSDSELIKINDRLWRNYLKLYRNSKQVEGSAESP